MSTQVTSTKQPEGEESRSGSASGSSPAAPSSGTAASTPTVGGREKFEAFELSIVLSHYNVGVIEQIQEFPRGSRKAPKLILKTDTGLYLLKRRARGKDDAYKVAYCHGIQLFLASKQFPLPHLIGTRRDNNSLLQLSGTIYEMFEYIKGNPYDNSLEATFEAGRILALYHKLLRDFQSDYESAQGSYHNTRQVIIAAEAAPNTLARIQKRSPEEMQRIQQCSAFMLQSYNEAGQQVADMGFAEWPQQIVHSDWHPGNMLYRGSRVVAVIDYDTARVQQRVLDVANGCLQFSMLAGTDDPKTWPDYLDESRFKRFLRGYESVPDCLLSRAELKVIPWLMTEALIAECVIPIGAAGYFARIEGSAFMFMIERKVRWLQTNGQRLIDSLET